MKKPKYTYLWDWYAATKTLGAAERLEIADAINAYVFEGIEPELSPIARGIFATIKINLDAERVKRENISRKRASAGMAHKGNQHTKFGTNGTSVPKVLKDSELDENGEKFGTNGTNGTNVPNSLKTSNIGTSVPNPPLTPLNNIIITTTTTPTTPAYTHMMEWLGDNHETLQIIAHRNQLINRPMSIEELLEVLRPYVEVFVEDEGVREDIGHGLRREVKQHFQRWLPKYIQAKKNEKPDKQTNTNRRSSPDSTKGVATEADYWDI